jgi:FMN phosphatase YigB (HAD superfamily)
MVGPPESIVFDVGYVLVDVDAAEFLAALGPGARDLEAVCEAVDLDAHERGAYPGEVLIDRLASLASLADRPIDRGRLTRLWKGIYRPVPRMLELAKRLGETRRVYYLSNMGEPHWQHLQEGLGLKAYARDAIASFEVQLLKPDPAIFALAERRFALDPAQTLFIDDRAVNVRAAERRGWRGLVHRDVESTHAALAALGLG